MNWENHFHKIVDMKKKHDEESALKYKEQEAEMQRVYKTYAPQIRSVCKAFAKVVGWEYGDDSRITSYNSFAVSDWLPTPNRHADDLICRFEIELSCDRIDIRGKHYSIFLGALSMPLVEFSEDKLAKIFEEWYKKIVNRRVG